MKTKRQAKPTVTVADHVRYAELERRLDGMQSLEDAYLTREWNNAHFELECEVVALREFIEKYDS